MPGWCRVLESLRQIERWNCWRTSMLPDKSSLDSVTRHITLLYRETLAGMLTRHGLHLRRPTRCLGLYAFTAISEISIALGSTGARGQKYQCYVPDHTVSQ